MCVDFKKFTHLGVTVCTKHQPPWHGIRRREATRTGGASKGGQEVAQKGPYLKQAVYVQL